MKQPVDVKSSATVVICLRHQMDCYITIYDLNKYANVSLDCGVYKYEKQKCYHNSLLSEMANHILN